ncbi:hypothetical protein FOA52_007358 [Chlamydomonas sp. UWO 241]|nr:hypothetical protein FOA52_007358 [Chlamydomonas sp. UWO 241]
MQALQSQRMLRGHSGRVSTRVGVRVSAAPAVATKSVTAKMAELKAKGKVAFIPFLVAGDPDLDTTALAMQKLDAIGADVIELGVPYSDPLADGPVIQGAATRALEGGITLDKIIALVAKVSPTIKAPIVMFTYYNPIMRRGMDTFMKQIKAAGASEIKAAGVSALLVPDIPLEETVDVRAVANTHGIELVLLATPTTPKERMVRIAEATQGFVYLVGVTGVTGVRATMGSRVEGLVSTLHSVTDKPICVGFGVSQPEHAAQIAAWGAEGVICGSALVRALGESGSPAEGLKEMEKIAVSLRAAC